MYRKRFPEHASLSDSEVRQKIDERRSERGMRPANIDPARLMRARIYG